MTVFYKLQNTLDNIIENLGENLDVSKVTIEPPRDSSHGDLAINAAMILAKQLSVKPRDLAENIVKTLEESELIDTITIDGPGFINLRLSTTAFFEEVHEILRLGVDVGKSSLGQGQRVNVEYVSANPTGPMHAGHVRGAVIGDSIANLLIKAGYDVTKEYYFNDAGKQIEILAHSSYMRYREALGEDIGEIPEGYYPGEYLKSVGLALVECYGDKYLNANEEEWLDPIKDFAVERIMEMICQDLQMINIKHDVFTNERVLIENGTLDHAFKTLEDNDLIYTGTLPPPRGKEMDDWQPVPLTLFRSSNFGDDVDRPLQKRDGSWAYIMPDIAYHYDKIQRGFSLMINMLGKDHGGYEQRLGPAVAAFGNGKAKLKVVYNGMVKILKNGQPVKLSKRSGNLITLREMVEEVGADAVRFIMLTRSPESELEFDFTKAVETSRDNPVFYVQYAHARCCSVIRNANDMFDKSQLTDEALSNLDLSALISGEEHAVIRALANWPRIVEQAAKAYEPHRIAFYVQDVAAAFHSWWNAGKDDPEMRFLQEEDREKSLARIALVRATAIIIASALNVIGVEAMQELRNDESDVETG